MCVSVCVFVCVFAVCECVCLCVCLCVCWWEGVTTFWLTISLMVVQSVCQALGGYLAEDDSAEEHQFLVAMVRAKGDHPYFHELFFFFTLETLFDHSVCVCVCV